MEDGTIVGISRDWRPVSKVFRQHYFIVIDWRQDESTIHGSKSNGWASFDQVRIPRMNMMMGMCEVSREGEFELKGDPRVLYSVMMAIRMQIIWVSGIITLTAT